VTKISQLSSIGDSLAIGDQFLIRDIDDAGSPNKSVTVSGITRALADGNATAPALAFAADKNTGIYRVGTDSLAVATNGTERLRIDSSGGATFKGGSIFIEATSDTNNAQISLGRPSSSSAGYIRYINSENALAFRTNGSGEDVRIDSSGRLGIGTSSPSYTLHVATTGSSHLGASARVDAGSSNQYVDINPNSEDKIFIKNYATAGDSGGIKWFQRNSINTSFRYDRLFVDPDNGLQYYSKNGSDFIGTEDALFTISRGGNVGIGTTSPGYTLVLSATSANIEINDFTSPDATSETGIRFSNNATTHALLGRFGSQDFRISNTGNIVFATGGISTANEKARIDSSGRLLVGTSSTTADARAVFQATSSAATQKCIVYLQRGSTNPTANQDLGFLYFADSAQSAGASIQATADGNWASGDYPTRLVFSTTEAGAASPTERMRIKSNGDLWLGAPSANPGYGTSTTGFGWRNDTDTLYVSAASDPALRLNRNGDGAVVEFRHTGNAVAVGSITVTVAATAYNTSSDYRLKENVTAVSDGITRLQQLKPSRFNFIADPAKTVDGFIAHEVQAVVPEAITGEKDAVDDDGNPEYQGIDQSKLVPLLTAALQEAIGEIESLKARVAALEAN
jgi:hypothetical protein